MRLVTVGTSGSFAGPDSPASCHLVQVPADVSPDGRAWNVVLDLGNGSLGALQRQIDPLDLDAVLVSHLHPDHFVDLCGLYVYLRYHPLRGTERAGGRSAGEALPVWGPSDVAARVGAAYGLDAGEDMSSQLDFRGFEAGQGLRVGPLEIEPFRMFHPVPAFGVRITGPSSERPGERVTLAYTGDTDYCAEVVELARDVDLLLCEAAFLEGRDDAVEPGVHLTGRRAGRVAREARAARLVLTHVPAWNDVSVTSAEARGEYTGPVEVATSGATFTL